MADNQLCLSKLSVSPAIVQINKPFIIKVTARNKTRKRITQTIVFHVEKR